MLKATESVGKRRETTDRCGKKVEGTESVFKKGRELEKYIYFLNAEGNLGTEKKGELYFFECQRQLNVFEKKVEATESVGKKRRQLKVCKKERETTEGVRMKREKKEGER